MNTYDLEVAFYERLTTLEYSSQKTLLPDEIFDPKEFPSSYTVRRGLIVFVDPNTVGFRHGVYTRVTGLYQIDLWVPRVATSAIKTLKNMADAHLAHFWPENGRGLTLTENHTSAHIVRRPGQRQLGRDGSYLREMVEVDFFVDIDPSA